MGILNKITPEKFEKLITDILNIIGNGSNVIFKGDILLIFEKALDEPKYSSMYAQLCKRLSDNAPNLEPPESKITTFKRLLLNRCKDEFENRAAISTAFEKRIGDLSVDEEEARYLAKRKMLGNIKFIGELGKLEMLHDSILHRCAEQLLVGRRKQSLNDQTEDIECLAHLMKTCGRLLDSAKAKMRMDQYFDRIRAIINNPDMPTRIKFLLQNMFKESNIKLMDHLPTNMRTEEQLREQLEQRQLSFLVPLLAIKADMWRQLETGPDCGSFLNWVLDTVPESNRKDPSFISALIASVVRFIAEQTTLKDTGKTPEKEVTDKEKEMIGEYKQVLQTFLTNQELQLAAVYALQVFCFSRGFPKGMLLLWFVSLYEADIVDEHVFLKWKEDVNDSYPGKGKALFQVNQWLTWLEEA